MTFSQRASTGASSSPDHHHTHPTSDHIYNLNNTHDHYLQDSHTSLASVGSSGVASSSRRTLDHDQAFEHSRQFRITAPSRPSESGPKPTRRGSAVSPPSSPASPPTNLDDKCDPSSQSAHLHLKDLHSSNVAIRSSHAEHPNTSAMATLTVNTPPAIHQSDPMLQARTTNSLLHKSAACVHQHHHQHQHRHQHQHSPSPPPPPASYTQPPVTSSLATVTSGDGWVIVPNTSRACAAAAVPPSSVIATSARQQPASTDTFGGLSQIAHAHAANDMPNRRCGPSDLTSSYDVPFGERASPAIISLAQRGAMSLSRNGTRPPSPLALSPAMVGESLNPSGAHRGGLRGSDEDIEASDKDVSMVSTDDSCAFTGATPLVPPATRKLCVRHQRMADEGTTARLQKSIESLPLADQTAVNTVWSLFSSSSHSRRALILQGILTMCCFSQLSLLSSELALAIRIDPFSLFPREVSLKVLGHLDAMSLGRAAQVSRSWKQLADDDLLWRNMCEQHIERKCEKCGWGLPLLSERRRRVPGPAVQLGTPESRDLSSDGSGATSGAISSATPGSLKRTITAAANAAALEKQSRSRASSPTPSSSRTHSRSVSGHRDLQMESISEKRIDRDAPPLKKQRSGLNGEATACGSSSGSVPKTRPWKSVYCERLAIERNWRRGRYTSRALTGHTDGIMCLQFNENLAHPAFPVVITGSYDRTARIWNLETGEMLRVLEGHTRGVRCLQFDEAKLITGSMDRTLKIWNWRTGALMRTLEGHTEGIVCLHFNEDTLASGSADSNIKIWNFRTGECYTLRGHRDWVNAVTLWTGPAAKKRQQRLREALREGKPASSIKEEDSTAAGTFLFSASDDGSIRLWDLGLRECLLTFEGHVGQVQSLKLVMMDDEAVRKLVGGAAGGMDGESPHQNQRNGGSRRQPFHEDVPVERGGDQDMLSVEDQESYFLGDASLSPSRRQSGSGLASSVGAADIGSNNITRVGAARRLSNAAEIPERFFHAGNNGNVFGASSSCRAAQGSSSSSSQRQHQHQQRRKIDKSLLRVQDRLCQAGLVDPLPLDAEMGDLDPTIRLPVRHTSSSDSEPSSSTSAPPLKNQTNHHAKPRPVLISGSLDNTLKIWDVRTGRCVRTLFGHVEGVWSLDVDKLRIASASHDRTIKIWDRDTGFCQNTLVGHKGAVTCVSLSDDKIVSGSDDGDLRLWSFAAAANTATGSSNISSGSSTGASGTGNNASASSNRFANPSQSITTENSGSNSDIGAPAPDI
ncbi:related to MET30 - involved in regulation of sulfur assimilation genes and cell cycle progression [Melanopsichium pennsylvanicum]|uniref:Related to MET30 - involved in regulation of sulfur assimilation genes and cell cycle progression n=1 Tax=Melanopsichium pennsylvanicum TaxID=63383 RepID=A0AAJ4XSJ4_9BASI|nr:related to MET30 - involved in regulation of sulfur assimilation genes and cell cycle progression [Melanopsichium pennsylvanicum]